MTEINYGLIELKENIRKELIDKLGEEKLTSSNSWEDAYYDNVKCLWGVFAKTETTFDVIMTLKYYNEKYTTIIEKIAKKLKLEYTKEFESKSSVKYELNGIIKFESKAIKKMGKFKDLLEL